jgi:hypothetical protein
VSFGDIVSVYAGDITIKFKSGVLIFRKKRELLLSIVFWFWPIWNYTTAVIEDGFVTAVTPVR